MSKPESIKALLNNSPQQRPGKDRIRYLDDPITAKQLNEANLCHEKSCECFVAANDYLAHGLQREGDRALNDAIFYSRRAVSHFASFSEAYTTIASACLLKGDFNRAIEVCKEIQHIKPDALDFHFYWARALFNLAVKAVEKGDPESAAILLTEAMSEAQTEIFVGGVSSQLVAVLTQIFALKVRLLSQSVITAGLDSSEAELLREALDCQIICAEKLHQLQLTRDNARILKDLREIRLRLQPLV